MAWVDGMDERDQMRWLIRENQRLREVLAACRDWFDNPDGEPSSSELLDQINAVLALESVATKPADEVQPTDEQDGDPEGYKRARGAITPDADAPDSVTAIRRARGEQSDEQAAP